MMDTLTLNYDEKTITVVLDDGTETTYRDRAAYLADWPEREADCVAVGL